jgi:hypothetical protein
MVHRRSATEVHVYSRQFAISNVVLQFADGSRQRFEDVERHVASFSGTGSHAHKEIAVVWVKAGPNFSGDGPGYGDRFDMAPHLSAMPTRYP